MISSTELSINGTELPLKVLSGSRGFLNALFETSGLPGGNYVINGTGRFSQYDPSSSSYAYLSSGFKIILHVGASQKTSWNNPIISFIESWFLLILIAIILSLIGIGLLLRSKGY